jgi:hypothetical protein
LPDLQTRFVEPYAHTDLKVVALNPDNTEVENIGAVAEFAYDLDIHFPIGVETGDSAYDLFQANYDGANPYPTDVIIDRDGIIRFVAVEYDPVALEDALLEVLFE